MNDIIDIHKTEIVDHKQSLKENTIKYWDKDYINNKLDGIKNINHQMLIRFLWMTGFRITEVLNIRKKDIDFENYLIKLRWLKSRKFKYRIAPLHPNLRDILMLYASPFKTDEIIFNISRQRAWQIVQKHLGGKPHKLRHSFAVNWLLNEGNIVMLSKIMGHKYIKTTMKYLEIVPIDQGKELMKIKFK